jgi:hypothetical protein
MVQIRCLQAAGVPQLIVESTYYPFAYYRRTVREVMAAAFLQNPTATQGKGIFLFLAFYVETPQSVNIWLQSVWYMNEK